MIRRALKKRLAGRSIRATAQAAGIPTTKVRIVETAACHTVNHRIRPVDLRRMTSIAEPSSRPLTIIEATG